MNEYLGFQCCLKINDALYFPSFRGNGLFRYDGEEVECIACFEEKGVKLFSGIESYGQKLFFTPFAANRIYTYDLSNKKISSICYDGHRSGDFAFSVLYGHCIYMFPSQYPGILKLNLVTLNIEKINDWMYGDFKKYQLEDNAFFKGEYVQKDDVIYAPFLNASAVMEFNLNDGSSIVHGIGVQGYETIADDGKQFWMMSGNGTMIVCWNSCTDEIKVYEKFPENYKQGTFVGSYFGKGYVWLFPESANMVLKVDTMTGGVTEERLYSKVCKHKWLSYSLWSSSFIFVAREKEKVLLCCGKSSQVIEFDVCGNKLKCSRLHMPREISRQYHEEPDIEYVRFRKIKYTERKNQRKFFFESEEYLLHEFLEDVERDDKVEEEPWQDLSAGELIYKNIL